MAYASLLGNQEPNNDVARRDRETKEFELENEASTQVPFSELLAQISRSQVEAPQQQSSSEQPIVAWTDRKKRQADFLRPPSVGRPFQSRQTYLRPKDLSLWDQDRATCPSRSWATRGAVAELYDSQRSGKVCWRPAGHARAAATPTPAAAPPSRAAQKTQASLEPDQLLHQNFRPRSATRATTAHMRQPQDSSPSRPHTPGQQDSLSQHKRTMQKSNMARPSNEPSASKDNVETSLERPNQKQPLSRGNRRSTMPAGNCSLSAGSKRYLSQWVPQRPASASRPASAPTTRSTQRG